MECKVVLFYEILRRLARFNRDIVECKAGSGRCHASSNEDLIETLWNVKKRALANKDGGPEGFNRDIVECKDRKRRKGRPEHGRFNRDIVECKGIRRKDRKMNKERFNRDIVECKVERMGEKRRCRIQI